MTRVHGCRGQAHPLFGDLESLVVFPGGHPPFPVCQSSHHLFPNPDLFGRFCTAASALSSLGASSWCRFHCGSQIPETGHCHVYFLLGAFVPNACDPKFLVFGLSARFLFTLSSTRAVFLLQFSSSSPVCSGSLAGKSLSLFLTCSSPRSSFSASCLCSWSSERPEPAALLLEPPFLSCLLLLCLQVFFHGPSVIYFITSLIFLSFPVL